MCRSSPAASLPCQLRVTALSEPQIPFHHPILAARDGLELPGSCNSCFHLLHFTSFQHPKKKKLSKFSLPPLTVTYLIIAHGAWSLAQLPTFTPRPTAPRHLREGLEQPPAPPERLLCSEMLDCTLSTWVNDDGAGKGG